MSWLQAADGALINTDHVREFSVEQDLTDCTSETFHLYATFHVDNEGGALVRTITEGDEEFCRTAQRSLSAALRTICFRIDRDGCGVSTWVAE